MHIMSQRHQVYLRIPAIDGIRPAKTIGLHHPILGSETALLALQNFLYYVVNKKDDDRDDYQQTINFNASELLRAAYSFIPSIGFFSTLPCVMAETDNPKNCENDSGITVIDLESDPPQYCFAQFNGNETETIILDAHQYTKHYYPEYESGDRQVYATQRLAIFELEDFPLIDSDRLKEIFPQCVSSTIKNP